MKGCSEFTSPVISDVLFILVKSKTRLQKSLFHLGVILFVHLRICLCRLFQS